MHDSVGLKQKKESSLFSQPIHLQINKKIKQNQTSEQSKDLKKFNSQQGIERLRSDQQIQKVSEHMKESMRSSNKSKTYMAENNNNQKKLSKIFQTPIKYAKENNDQIIKEESESELHHSITIEQEHSRIILNEGLQKQASKKAFLLFNESENIHQQENSENSSQQKVKSEQKYINMQSKYSSNEVEDGEKIDDSMSQELEYEEQKNQQINNYSLELRVSHNLNWLILEIKHYKDQKRFLLPRKICFFAITLFEIICYRLLSSTIFDLFEMFITLANIFLFLNRTSGNYGEVNQYQYVLCFCYFIDAMIHLAGQGIKKYLSSFWNIYDLCILILYFLFIVQNNIMPFDVSTFRLIRIPFYIGRINNTVNIILMSIKEALKQIVENLMILILFTVLIAILMLYAFNGVLRYRCMEEELGIFTLIGFELGVCGYKSCPIGYVCARQLRDIDVPTNFDNIIFAYFQTIRTSIVNDWTITMYMLMKQFNPFVCLLYIFIIFAINKFYFQLLIAVLKVYYHKTQEFYIKNPIKPEFYEDQISVDLRILQDCNIWKQIKEIISLYQQNQLPAQIHSIQQNKKRKESQNQLNNQDKVKFLSARQQIDMINERKQTIKQFTYDSWILNFLYPHHHLQKRIQNLITDSETIINNLKIFYSLLSLDYLSLFIFIKKNDDYQYLSSEDVLINDSIKKQAPQQQIKFKKRILEYTAQKIIGKTQNIKFTIHPFPIKKVSLFKNQTVNILDSNSQYESEDESQFSRSPKLDIKQKKYIKKLSKRNTQQDIFKNNSQVQIHAQNQSRVMQSTQLTKSEFYHNKEMYNNLKEILNIEFKQEIINIKNYEELYNEKIMIQEQNNVYYNYWSGNDSIQNYQNQYIISDLNKGWQFVYKKGIFYYLGYIQFHLYYFITKPFIMIMFDMLICINILMFTFSQFSNNLFIQYFDLAISFAIFLEMGLKALMIKHYISDLSHFFGLLIIGFSVVEGILSLNNDDQSVVIYTKILKSLFFFRVIKYNTFAQNMMMISYQTFPNYAVIALLLFFLILNYAVFSLQIFNFPDSNELKMYHYFGNIYQSWIAVYDISTGDDWYGVVILSTTYGIYYIGFLFCISLVFIVNYFGFGLSFVIILDGFANYMDNAQEKHSEIVDEQNTSLEIIQQENKSEKEEDQSRLLSNQEKVRKDHYNISLKNLLSTLIQVEDTEKYSAISNQYSLFIISKRNKLRKICFKISENQCFQFSIAIVLCGSLVNMILITYYDDIVNEFWNIFEIIKCICNLLILFDALIKIITYGVICKETYFDSIWVVLDFIYVVCYFLYLITDHIVLKWILLLSYLRPLKVTSTFGFFINERGAIMKSLGDILKIFYVILLFWFVFAIFGMAIYKDRLGYCNNYFNYGVGKDQCDGEWIIYPHNFDDIIQAMQTLFTISTLDGWGITFFVCINSSSDSTGPLRFNSEWVSYLFFFSFTFIGALFFLQFFAGVIFVNFYQNKLQLLNPDLSLDQELFLKLTEIIMLDTPNYSKPPKKGLRMKAKQLIEHQYYTLATRTSLIFNLFILVLFYESANTLFLRIINDLHHFCSLILLIDTILKLFTYHLKRYFDDVWRQMQLFFVIFAILDFSFDIQFDFFIRYARASRDDPYFIWLRLFILNRCLRLSLIIQQFTRVRKLLNVIYFNKMAILRILGLFITVLSCYSYIGCELFSQPETGSILNDQLNYKNFFYGILATFKCTTENGWRFIYVDQLNVMKSNEDTWILSSIYFYSLIFIGARVLMNLIVCELVQEFEKFYDTSSSCLETYVETIDKFRNLWCKYTEEYEGKKMQTKYLAHFILDLGEPLGALTGDNIWDAAKLASGYELKKDFDGCLTFRNLLYEVIKLSFKESIFKISSDAGKKIMKENDKRIKYRLYNQREHSIKRERVHQIVDLQSNFNVLQEYLYLYMALKAWKKFSEYFFSIAGEVQNTIDFSESDVEERISDMENLDDGGQIEQVDLNTIYYLKVKKRRPSKEHLRRPTDVYILPYYDEIPQHYQQINEILLKPTDMKQQNKLKSISVIKKKEQLIKYKEYNRRRDGIDKQIISRNRYLYGYHEKMIRPQYEEKSDNRLMSKLDPIKMPSVYNITKVASRLK